MKKVLIVGESDIVFLKNYVEDFNKYYPEIKFTILTYSKKRYLDFYKEHNIRLIKINYNNNDFEKKLSNRIILKLLKGRFDYIHLHPIDIYSKRVAELLNDEKSKIIISYWAHITNKKYVKEIGNIIDKAYKISFVTGSVQRQFQNNYGYRYDKECICVDFSNACIRNMFIKMKENNNPLNLRQEAKRNMSFPLDKMVVAVGYCGRKDQQHLKVLETLQKISPSILEQIYIFIHCSYSIDDLLYIKKIQKKLEWFTNNGYHCRFSDEYMQGERLAYLRLGVDAYINAETVDALSASVQEYLFAGAVVFNPEWLDYSELEKEDVEFIKYRSFDELGSYFNNKLHEIKIVTKNRKPIWNRKSRKRLLEKWVSLYD